MKNITELILDHKSMLLVDDDMIRIKNALKYDHWIHYGNEITDEKAHERALILKDYVVKNGIKIILGEGADLTLV